jgi:alanine racemase
VRPSWVEIDGDAIRHNVSAIAGLVAPAEVCAVVKADGYGHGDVPTAEAAIAGGAGWLAVAIVAEGIRLREAGLRVPILLLSEPPAGDVDALVRWRLTPTVYTERLLDPLARRTGGAPHPVHLKVDTGMHRVGAPPAHAAALAQRIVGDPRLALEGVWTHFAVAEDDAEFTATQLAIFHQALAEIERAGIDPGIRHVANTAGAIGYPEARLDMVRVGLGIYGMRPAPHVGVEVDLKPAMRVVSHVSYVRRHPAGTRPSYGRRRPLAADATVATVPVGYADGVTRRLSAAGGEVLIKGRRFPFAGTVTMDQVVIDVGDAAVDVDDEVVLLGRQGDDVIRAEEWAEWLDTINYEVVCGFGPRLPRRYDGSTP